MFDVQPFTGIDSRFTHTLTLNVGANSRADIREALAERFTREARKIIIETPKPYQKRLVGAFASVFNKRVKEQDFEPWRAARGATARVKAMARGVKSALVSWSFPLTLLYSADKREQEAKRLVDTATAILSSFKAETGPQALTQCDLIYHNKLKNVYAQLTGFYQMVGIVAPSVLGSEKTPVALKNESLESAILRMVCDKWVLRKIDRLARRTREQAAIAMGDVGKHSPYVSQRGLQEYRHMQKAAASFLDNYTLVNEEIGAEITMREAAQAGQSNPVNRRTELMIRANGLQDIAYQAGMKAYFLTITAPSKYHFNSGKYAGYTPRQAHNYLQECWVLTRALWSKEGIKAKGVRVVEPHKDACPHWHMLVFLPAGLDKRALEIAADTFCKVDRAELTNKQTGKEDISPRFDSKFMFVGKDETGKECSPVAYLTKYISKNIDGFGLEGETDREAPEHEITDLVESVTAWSRIHGVRQFQFFGLESVTLWREVRRVKGENGEIINQLIDATGGKKGDDKKPSWITFEALAREHSVMLDKVERRSEAYNDVVKVIKGVSVAGKAIETRKGEWVREFLTASRREALEANGSLRSWTGENNCNQSSGSNDYSYEIFTHLGASSGEQWQNMTQ